MRALGKDGVHAELQVLAGTNAAEMVRVERRRRVYWKPWAKSAALGLAAEADRDQAIA